MTEEFQAERHTEPGQVFSINQQAHDVRSHNSITDFMAENAQGLTVGIYAFWRLYRSGRGGEKHHEVMTASVQGGEKGVTNNTRTVCLLKERGWWSQKNNGNGKKKPHFERLSRKETGEVEEIQPKQYLKLQYQK